MTIILITALMTSLLAWFFYKPIHKYEYIVYGVSIIIALFAHEEANIISLGYIPFGIFLPVMLSGVLEKGKLRKRLFMVRKELAIVAGILIAPHVLGYLEYFLDEVGIFQGDLSFYIGIIAVICIIPLWVTSFSFIRKRMSYKTWKSIHKYAYLFYGLVALHLILIQNTRMPLYIALFGGYGLLKLWMIYNKKSHKKPTLKTSESNG